MRRLHRLGRRPGDALLPHRRVGGRGFEDHDDRGTGFERPAAPRPAGLPGRRSFSMWLLHVRNDRRDGSAARYNQKPFRRRSRRILERQHLPLRDISANPRGSASGGRGDGQGNTTVNWLADPEKLLRELSEHEVAGRLHWFDFDRRRFLQILGGGVLVCVAAPAVPASGQESGKSRGAASELPKDLAAWLHVGADGRVTVFTGKVEIGQNIRTSLSQQVAEELRVPVASIEMVMGDTDRTPYDMGTFGSRTTPTMAPQLRGAAATARELLLDAAAERWKTDRSSLAAEDGKILDRAARRTISYGELTQGKELIRSIEAPALAAGKDWKIAGTSTAKVNGRDFVTGAHRYTSDLSRPGMLHGKVYRPSGFKAKLVSVDISAAEKVPGVRVVRDGDFVGVVAADAFSAEKAVAAIDGKWNVPPQPSDQELFEYLKKNGESGDHGRTQTAGSVGEARARADVKLSSRYTVAYIAHAPLEPRAAVAEWTGEKLTVWTGTQRPFAVKEELAEAFHIPAERVRVLVPDTGSAYGGKHTGDAAVEAARLAKSAGKPVKVVWTREEEFTWAYLRPAGVIEIESGARRDGALVAWEFHNYNSGSAGIGTPYD